MQSFWKITGSGGTAGELVHMSNLSGFSAEAANLLEMMLLEGAQEGYGI